MLVLLFLGGWLPGWVLFNSLTNLGSTQKMFLSRKDESWCLLVRIILWSILWTWVCWGFMPHVLNFLG